jgi:porin
MRANGSFVLIWVALIASNAIPARTRAADTNTPPAAAGLLPVPDYSGDFWTRRDLAGDWGGVRSDLANKGVQFGLQWNQYGQGIVDGGRDRTSTYGGNLDYTLNLDLMRMGVLPGALVKFRAETRYGRSVNGLPPHPARQ